jgi:hypothetical protein
VRTNRFYLIRHKKLLSHIEREHVEKINLMSHGLASQHRREMYGVVGKDGLRGGVAQAQADWMEVRAEKKLHYTCEDGACGE